VLASDPVAVPYAQALVELAQEQGLLEEVRDQVAALLDAFAREPDGLVVLESPRVTEDAKAQVVEKAFRGKLHDVVTNTLGVVVKRGRGMHLRAVCEETVARADAALDRVTVLAQTAEPLDDAAREKIRGVVKSVTGHTPMLDEKVRPELLGGLRIRVGDHVVDATMRARLREMRRRLDRPRLTADVFDDQD
jgi:F-type H+-transporting ATPase subunit delta